MSKHTPTPWHVTENANYMGHRIDAEDGRNVFLGSTDYETAAFIVRACNAHERLVEELENLIEFAEDHNLKGLSMDHAREALTKAREKTD